MKNIKFLLAVFTLIIGLTTISSAQNATFQTLDGGTVSLASQKGKVVILAVGASWLPLSKQQAVINAKLAKKYAGKDVVIYFVATDSANAKSKNFASDEQIKAFVTRSRMTVPVLRDSDGAISLKKFNLDQLPSFVVIDKDGNMAGEAFGGLDVDPTSIDTLTSQISQAVDKLL